LLRKSGKQVLFFEQETTGITAFPFFAHSPADLLGFIHKRTFRHADQESSNNWPPSRLDGSRETQDEEG